MRSRRVSGQCDQNEDQADRGADNAQRRGAPAGDVEKLRLARVRRARARGGEPKTDRAGDEKCPKERDELLDRLRSR